MMGGYGYGAMMGWSWVFWILIIVGVVLLVLLAVRLFGGGLNRTGTGRGTSGAETGRSAAKRILDERYAKGELDTQEYRERLKGLEDGA